MVVAIPSVVQKTGRRRSRTDARRRTCSALLPRGWLVGTCVRGRVCASRSQWRCYSLEAKIKIENLLPHSFFFGKSSFFSGGRRGEGGDRVAGGDGGRMGGCSAERLGRGRRRLMERTGKDGSQPSLYRVGLERSCLVFALYRCVCPRGWRVSCWHLGEFFVRASASLCLASGSGFCHSVDGSLWGARGGLLLPYHFVLAAPVVFFFPFL